MPNADQIRVFRDEGGAWRWTRVAPNGENVSTSGEDFDSKENAQRSAEREAEGTEAEVITVEPE